MYKKLKMIFHEHSFKKKIIWFLKIYIFIWHQTLTIVTICIQFQMEKLHLRIPLLDLKKKEMSNQRVTNWNPLHEREVTFHWRAFIMWPRDFDTWPMIMAIVMMIMGQGMTMGNKSSEENLHQTFYFCHIVATNTITNPQLLGKRHRYFTFCLIYSIFLMISFIMHCV